MDRTGLESNVDNTGGKLSKVNDKISDVRGMSATWKISSTRKWRLGGNKVLEMRSVVNQKKQMEEKADTFK